MIEHVQSAPFDHILSIPQPPVNGAYVRFTEHVGADHSHPSPTREECSERPGAHSENRAGEVPCRPSKDGALPEALPVKVIRQNVSVASVLQGESQVAKWHRAFPSISRRHPAGPEASQPRPVALPEFASFGLRTWRVQGQAVRLPSGRHLGSSAQVLGSDPL
jgi:hypothetical protein